MAQIDQATSPMSVTERGKSPPSRVRSKESEFEGHNRLSIHAVNSYRDNANNFGLNQVLESELYL
jgi:hypothetical protein